MTDVPVTSPEPGTPEPLPGPEVTPEPTPGQGLEPAPDAPGLDDPPVEPTPQAPETVEIEIDGRKYQVDPTLKDGYLRQQDYTSKTQELADGRKALDGERETLLQQAQHQRQHLEDYGELSQTLKQIAQYEGMDWAAAQNEDPENAQLLSYEFNRLREQRDNIVGRIRTAEHNSRVTAEREGATRNDQLKANLARDIPNYTPEVHAGLESFATEQGITKQELAQFGDARHYKMLHLAKIGAEVLKKQAAITTPGAPAPVTPVPKVTGGRTPSQGPTDAQGVDAWMKNRNRQLGR